jgi:hypothetical protein
MTSLIMMILNVHKFVRHEWKKIVPRSWKNLGTWRYVTTFKYCYPTIPQILKSQYWLKDEDRIIVYIMKEISLPHFRRYRTKFKKVFYGSLKEYKAYIREFLQGRVKRKD